MKIDWTTFGADGKVDWAAVEAELPYAAAMAACIQDPVYHAEGDVLTHTKLVMDRLVEDDEFRALTPKRRNVLALAALWHDVAKPETRVEIFDEEIGRTKVSHPHHAARGAMHAWRDLWRAGVPLDVRRDVFALVLGHQQVFRVLQGADPRMTLARLSTLGSVYELTMLAKADNRGRICPDKRVADDEMDLVRIAADENNCLYGPWPFASAQARFRFARGVKDSLFFEPQPPKGSHVILLSGLPGMGKDTYIRSSLKDYAHVSLDLTREEMDVAATENQGRVAQATIEACRVHLRAKAPFVFNATNLTRLQRSKWVTLAVAYDANVSIHAMDVSERRLRKNNRDRKDSVPDAVIDRMIAKWEPPTTLEAHSVVWIGEDLKPVPVVNDIPDIDTGRALSHP
jgi:predicted kinase